MKKKFPYDFPKWVGAVRTPLALAGVVIFTIYHLYSQVLALIIYEKLGADASFHILKMVIDKIFWIFVLAIVLGVISYLVKLLVRAKIVQ